MRIHTLDTHCHVDLYDDPAALVKGLEQHGVYTIAVTNTPSVFDRTVRLTRGQHYVRPAIGLHPELASSRNHELPLFWSALRETRYVGEIGLDYMVGTKSERQMQARIFEEIVHHCNGIGDRVLTIHSRRAVDDVLDILGPTFRGTAILHWFTGSTRSLNRAIGLGCYISVNHAMIRSDRALTLLRLVPRERLLLESDGPFINVGGRPAQPEDLADVIHGVARLWGVSMTAAARCISNNAISMLTPKGKSLLGTNV